MTDLILESSDLNTGNYDKTVLPHAIKQSWDGGIHVSRMLAISSFKLEFWEVSLEHLKMIEAKLVAGEVDGSNFTLDPITAKEKPYGDFMAIIGADLVKDGTDEQKASVSFFNFCLRYGTVPNDAPFIVWMRAIQPKDTPSTSAIAQFFHVLIKDLIKYREDNAEDE